MHSKQYALLICFSLAACSSAQTSDSNQNRTNHLSTTNEAAVFKTVLEIPPPPGYKRLPCDSNSFANYLLHIPLKKDKTVFLYNGSPKRNQQAQFAVLDISVGNQDLQQCADAVMRLRAEYLFATKQFDKMLFYDNEKTAYRFSAPYTREHFQSFLKQVFGMCGSASLSKQLMAKKMEDIMPGDVLIRGGFPGHAVIVLDVATDAAGNKAYLIAQSYMPAQDIHILVNPSNSNSPWYFVHGQQQILTPEYVFSKDELKQW